jgi:hypothetical protein
MTQLLKELTQFFASKPQSNLEYFINSKRPTTAAEVDFWTREYEQSAHWGRGL